MRMKLVSSLSVLTALVLALSGCEDEPEQTRERLDESVGQREVQDLFRDEDEGSEGDEGDEDSSRQEDREEEDD
jgi:hypothetical protein